MFLTRPPKLRAVVAIVVSTLAVVSGCGQATPPAPPAGPPSTTVPLGPRSTVTVDVTGVTPPPKIDVATLSISQGSLMFRDVRAGPAPVHQRLPFTPPPGADSMGVVVRFFASDPDQNVDCSIAVDGVVVAHEEHVNGCDFSSDPRWTYLLIKGVVPGRYWPPDG